MREVVFYVMTFVLIYLFYLLFVILRKNKLEKFRQNVYVTFLVNVYGIDLNQISFKGLAHVIALTNSFIIATTLLLISIIPNFILKMVSGFFLLIPFQFFMYFLIGKVYQKKSRKKEQ